MNATSFDRYLARASVVHRLDPRVKVVVALAFIAGVALLPDGAWAVYGAAVALVLAVAVAARLSPWLVVRRSLVGLPFLLAAVTVLFIPGRIVLAGPWGLDVSDAGLLRFGSIVGRSLISLSAAVLLTATTRFPDVLHALRHLRVPAVLVAGPAGALSDKVGRPRLILAGWAVYALIYLGLALAGAGWQIVALFIVYGLYHGLVEGNARAYVADLAGAEARGAAYGLYHAVVGLLTLPASLIAGLLWQGVGGWAGFGPSAPFWFGAGLAGLAAGLLAAETRRGRAEAG